jgi:hypothetical protein
LTILELTIENERESNQTRLFKVLKFGNSIFDLRREIHLPIFKINELTTYRVVGCYVKSKERAVPEKSMTITGKKFIDILIKE